MANYKGMSYSIVGDEKKPATSLNRKSDISSGLISGISKGFNIKLPKVGLTASFSPKKLIKKKLKDLIKTKPKLINLSEYQNLGFQANLVGYDEGSLLTGNIDKPMSPRLINWVEPYTIAGLKKTLFYTEVNSGLKVGDRVFIIGGNYDSDELIKVDKYKRGRDGYKVLFVDKCQIVLDIDYTGINPWEDTNDDDFMRVHFVDSQDDFVTVEKAITTRGGQFDRKFNKYQNNIIYTNKNYGPISVWGNQAKLVEAPGFFVRTPSPVLSIDDIFNSGGSGFNLTSQVYDIAIQADGKLIVVGSFTSYNGVSANRIIRLNVDGSIDSSFNTGSGFNGIVETVALQSTGKIIVAGRFTTYNGSSTINNRMVRLNTNGSIDNTFMISTSFTWITGQERVNKIVIESTDKIYVGGNFTNVNGSSRNSIARLTSSGTLDTTFNPGTGFSGIGTDLVKTMSLQSTGKIIVGGSFTNFNGNNTLRKIIRLTSFGLEDTINFLPNGFQNTTSTTVYSIEIQPDDKILIGGNFTTYNSNPLIKIGRFNSDCSEDTTFNTNTNNLNLDSDVRTIKVLGTKIFLGGNFLNYSKIISLNTDGTINDYLPLQSGFNYTVYKIISDSFNQLVIGGDFTFYNGVAVSKIAKLEESNWLNITDKFIIGSFSEALSPTYTNNGKVKIFYGSFTYSINEEVSFKQNYVYKFDKSEEPNNFQGTYSTWKVDVKYMRPILSKTNFRDGNFDGEWNVGLFGRHNKRIIWEGNVSTWNTGTVLNTRWLKGDFKSKYSLAESYFSEIDKDGIPTQKLNGPNNNGRGFNFLIDSQISQSNIENASIFDTNLGPESSTYSIVESKLINSTIDTEIEIRRAYFENCSFRNTLVKNSEIRTSRVFNSDLDNVKTINSYFKKSYMKNSDFISDDVIKIFGYDEFNITIDGNSTTPTHKVYKFYIRKSDYNRLNIRDYFYIKGLDVVDGQKKLTNFFDKKFKLSSWYEYDDTISTLNNFYKRGTDCAAFLSTPEENAYTYTTVIDLNNNTSNQTISENSKKNYSVDIIFSIYDINNTLITGLDFNQSSSSVQTYSDETIFVEYFDSPQTFSEPINPSGYYDGKPYYILTNGTPLPYSYIFYTASNSRWEQWQNFDPSTGNTYGSDFYRTLSVTNSIPDSSTVSWVVAVDVNQGVINSIPYNPSPTLPQSLGNIINITNAYILDSDFESGILERSNWNSGYHINLNNDSNITIPSNDGGFYDIILQTQSSTLLATTTFNNTTREMNLDSLEVGSVVFLNSHYDTRGKILSITISNPGSGYTSNNNVILNGGSGTNSIIDFTSLPNGSVTGITLTSVGGGYFPGPPGLGTYTDIPTTPVSSLGSGLTVDITVNLSGQIDIATISNPGLGYAISDTVSIDANGAGGGAILTINSISNGEIISATLSNGGIQYQVGDVLTISGGNLDGQIQVISITGSITKLPDTYKIINVSNSQYELQEVTSATTSSISSLLDGGIFYTTLANNRYGYIHQSKFIKNSIKSGFFKRGYFKQNLFKNFDINLQDKDFNNILNFKNLLVSDTLFTNNSNILSKASYVQSSFIDGSDYWDDGLFYNSIWNGGIFRNGLIKESSWHDGIFENGLFYQSKSFDANPTINYQFYDTDRIKNYWKDGQTTATISNDRYSWRGGTFSRGEFLKSDWEAGKFLTGKFWNSKWYSGTFSSGTIGDKSISFTETWFYNGLIETAIVENAALYALDTSYNGLSSSNIFWKTGTFNDGIFGCDILIQTTASHTALWEQGTFNGGEFRTNGKWLDGVFNGGKFISGFGWTYSPTIDTISTSASQYAWETGEFNGGEFGDMGLGTNSTWWSGEFNGGVFQGRVWNEGIFTSGRFKGSGPITPVGGYSVDSMTESNASLFVDSFSQSFYGIWTSGIVSDVKDEFVKNKKLFTIPVRSIITNIPRTIVNFDNMLWLSGTFSHPGGKINKSVWLDGSFKKGRLVESSFNPWVIRPNETQPSFNLNDDLILASGSCIWEDGTLQESDFYISQWKKGQFLSGTAFGMVWKDGVANYMNAYNVLWENGTWRNGNWNGSYFIFDENITPAFNKQIIFRGMNWADSPYLHVWNVFKEEIAESEIMSATSSNPAQLDYFPPSAAVLVVR